MKKKKKRKKKKRSKSEGKEKHEVRKFIAQEIIFEKE